MLPPGHVAAGFLLGQFLSHHFGLVDADHNLVVSLTTFSAFAPDLDMFLDFTKNRRLTLDTQKNFHRAYVTHTPLLWLLLGLATYTFTHNAPLGLAVGTGGLLHLLLDMGMGGVKVFWPLSQQFFALKKPGHQASRHDQNHQQNFWRYWVIFLTIYATDPDSRPTFLAEIFVLAAAIVFLATH